MYNPIDPSVQAVSGPLTDAQLRASDVKVTLDGEVASINQSVTAPAGLASTANLDAGETFTSSTESTLGVAGIQVSLKMDQNGIVYVDQSPDGTNWDILDSYNYYAAINNFGITVQAINSYVRVRVTNSGSSATTYLRLQTALCPVVEALPRSLDHDGHLKVAVEHVSDGYGFSAENTPMGEVRAVEPYKLVGATFVGTTLDTRFWTPTVAGSGTAAQANGQLVLQTGATADSTASIVSVRNGRYIAGSSNRYRAVIRLPDAGSANNTRRWGAFTSTDGCFFQLSGTTFSVVTRKGSSDTVVSSGSFNGVLGSTFAPGTNARTWEIYWTNSKVYFVVGDDVLHTVSAPTAPWSATVSLPIAASNVNTGGGTADVQLEARVQSITRLGAAQSQPTSYYQSGTTAGVVLKYGAGNLHGVAVSGVANNSVITLYDNTAASGTILWSTGSMGANTVPFSIELHNIPFAIGLTLVISTANSNCVTSYE
jgi:hypothetical protein